MTATTATTTATAPTAVAPLAGQWLEWAEHWTVHLRARGLRPRTRSSYLADLADLGQWANATGRLDPLAITHRDVEAYIAHLTERGHMGDPGRQLSSITVAKKWTTLAVFFKWLSVDEDVPNPMARLTKPAAAGKRIDVFTLDELRALMATTEGRGFVHRRDAAIMRVLLDSGVRAGELAGLGVEDVDLVGQTLLVTGKGRGGGKTRRVAFGLKTTEALSRYLRARRRHRDADLPALWLAESPHSGALGQSGIALMLKRRGIEAGIEGVHPHRFRHTAYDAFTDAGGDPGNAMALFGWSSRAMLDHYASTTAERRALKQAKRLSPGDRV